MISDTYLKMGQTVDMFDNNMDHLMATIYTEYCENSEVFIEGSILNGIAKFFTKLIDSVNKTLTTIKLHLQRRIGELIRKGKLAKLRTELSGMRDKGINTVKVVDYWYIRDRYFIALKELKDLGLRLSRVQYEYGEQMTQDLAKWHDLKAKHDEILKRALNKEVKVPISKMMRFVDHELSKEEGLFDTIDDLTELYKAMEANINSLSTSAKIVGTNTMVKNRDKTIALSSNEVFLVKNIATGLAKWATDTIVWIINKALLSVVGL